MCLNFLKIKNPQACLIEASLVPVKFLKSCGAAPYEEPLKTHEAGYGVFGELPKAPPQPFDRECARLWAEPGDTWP